MIFNFSIIEYQPPGVDTATCNLLLIPHIFLFVFYWEISLFKTTLLAAIGQLGLDPPAVIIFIAVSLLHFALIGLKISEFTPLLPDTT